jgi:hypothetical protein
MTTNITQPTVDLVMLTRGLGIPKTSPGPGTEPAVTFRCVVGFVADCAAGAVPTMAGRDHAALVGEIEGLIAHMRETAGSYRGALHVIADVAILTLLPILVHPPRTRDTGRTKTVSQPLPKDMAGIAS